MDVCSSLYLTSSTVAVHQLAISHTESIDTMIHIFHDTLLKKYVFTVLNKNQPLYFMNNLPSFSRSYVEDPTRLSAREWVKAEGIPYSRELKSSAAFLSSPPLITFIVAQVVLGLIEINLAHYSDYRCSGDRPKVIYATLLHPIKTQAAALVARSDCICLQAFSANSINYQTHDPEIQGDRSGNERNGK